ncbi:MAG: hypothetical protein JKY83_08060 [Rhizobiaceae bacterium]|nr:hypothetical protein [Rhizobiaceae bacterium]
MAEFHLQEIGVLVDRYLQSKTELYSLVTAMDDLPSNQEFNSIRSLEQKVEESFTALLDEQPKSLTGALTKARFFIEEILSDTDLAGYQRRSLQALLDDFSSLDN